MIWAKWLEFYGLLASLCKLAKLSFAYKTCEKMTGMFEFLY